MGVYWHLGQAPREQRALQRVAEAPLLGELALEGALPSQAVGGVEVGDQHADHLPVLEKLEFIHSSSIFWSPEEQIAVARSGKRRGLQLIVPEPRDETLYFEQMNLFERMRPAVEETREVQPTLYELGW